jgi:hypothetical protein
MILAARHKPGVVASVTVMSIASCDYLSIGCSTCGQTCSFRPTRSSRSIWFTYSNTSRMQTKNHVPGVSEKWIGVEVHSIQISTPFCALRQSRQVDECLRGTKSGERSVGALMRHHFAHGEVPEVVCKCPRMDRCVSQSTSSLETDASD